MLQPRSLRLGPVEVREFEEYLAGRGPHLARLARLLAADRSAAEDLLQTALVRVLTSWDKVRRADDRDAYVGRIMVNAHRTALRRRRPEFAAGTVPDRLVPDRTDESDVRQVLVEALRLLPPGQRVTVVLRYYADLSETQVAAVLDCSVGTVRSQSARGLTALRSALAVVDGAGA